MPATPAWLAVVEASLERGIRASSRARTLASRLEGTALRVDIEGWTAVRAGISGGRLTLVAAGKAAADDSTSNATDATIAGSPLALFNLARGTAAGAAAAPPSARASVHGDAEIANLYRQLVEAARPEPEEELARLVGDLPARKISQLAQHAAAWFQKARRTAGENAAEYLQEESRDLVNQPQLDEFLQGVDALRESADRVEVRLARLEQRLKDSI
jgi:ubiquinone biosynthesis accessory factor UbiJ